MKSASEAIAPMPGEGGADSPAACAISSSPSNMVRLRLLPAQERLLGLLLAQVLVADHKIRQHEAQQRANRPRHDHTPKNPVGKTDHKGQRLHIAAVTHAIADTDGIGACR